MKAVAKERINANKAQAFKRVGGKNQANLAGLAKLDVRPAPPRQPLHVLSSASLALS